MAELSQDLNNPQKTEPELAAGGRGSPPAASAKSSGSGKTRSTREKNKPGDKGSIHLLKHITKLAEHITEEGLSERSLETIKDHLDPVIREFAVTPVQAALLSLCLVRYDDHSITMNDLASSINCGKLEFFQYQDDLQVLENKKLIRYHKTEGTLYIRVPEDLMEALIKGEPFKPAEHRNIPLPELLEIAETLFDQRSNEELTFNFLATEVKSLIDQNPHLRFSQKIKEYSLSDEDLVLLVYFCYIFAHYNNNNVWMHPVMELYDEKASSKKMLRALLDGSHKLMKKRLIGKETADEDASPASPDSATFSLTGKAKRELLGELGLKQKQGRREGRKENDLIGYKTIQSRKMFYNGPEAEQVDKLSSILRGDSYRAVCKRLADKGMRTGFVCLFSGSPGTGKTETAFQIARETKRDIMKVDIPHIIGAYVGESEKNIKDQFDHYRSVVKNTKTAPILLFNEADGLISKRMELTPHNPSVERMWNSMQNIILEEMEDLKGILIATTNMTINLDKAFERRFLFKIEFHKPDRPNRLSIWRSMIPELSGPDMESLADRFEFSGGQIENVARKWVMEQALSGSNPPMEKIISFCKEELLEKESPGNIGFSV